jgi:predicted ATP-dependent endonuclease of OLD family
LEILYIWIKDYKGIITEQGINFSSEYRFDYNVIDETLKCEINDFHISNFFIQSKEIVIKNLNAIIGENGVGKTSILDFIKYNLSEGIYSVKYDMILIFKDSRSKKIKIRYSSKLTISNISDIENIYNIKEYDVSDDNSKNINELKSNSIIFYSNIFDGRKEFPPRFDGGEVHNISTNFLINKDYYDYRNRNYSLENKSEHNLEFIRGSNPIIVHRKYEFKRQIYFIKDYKQNFPQIKIPDEIEVIVSELNINSIYSKKPTEDDLKLTEVNGHTLYGVTEKTEMNFNIYLERQKKNRINFIKCKIAKSIYFDFINNQNKLNYQFEPKNYKELIFSIIDNPLYELEIKIKKYIKGLKTPNTIFKNFGNIDEHKVKYLESLVSFIQSIDKFLNNDYVIKDFNQAMFKIENIKEHSKEVFTLIDKYLDTNPSLDYFDYNWFELSTGEKASLNFYSRFYELINRKINKFNKLKSNIIILIDEGELSYHPQWQKSYINNLLFFFDRIFVKLKKETVNLQIILTSNSPFIISDLPKSNVIFLKRDKNNKLESVQLFDQKQTFASNIHTLLTDSFFIQDGLIGEFAKNKIDNIINVIQNNSIEELNEIEVNEVKKTIEIIGEPIIKNKLIMMMEDKLRTNLIDSVERIKKLEKRVSDLEKNK